MPLLAWDGLGEAGGWKDDIGRIAFGLIAQLVRAHA